MALLDTFLALTTVVTNSCFSRSAFFLRLDKVFLCLNANLAAASSNSDNSNSVSNAYTV